MCRFLRAGVNPKLLYIVPVGQNPTGSRLSAYAAFFVFAAPFLCFWPRVGTLPLSQRALTSNRRPNPQTLPQEFEPRAPPPIFGSTRGRYEHIYRICARHGLVIVEDDAYYYMQHRADAASRALPGLRGLGPSFLSIDSDGRVLRLDSFSKLLAPGFRLGWVSGASSLVEAYDRVAYTSSQAKAQEKRRSQPVALISAHCPAPPHAAPHAAHAAPHAAARRRTPPQPRRTVAYRPPAFGSAVSVQTHAAAPSISHWFTVFVFAHPPISPICRTPLFPYLTCFYSCGSGVARSR